VFGGGGYVRDERSSVRSKTSKSDRFHQSHLMLYLYAVRPDGGAGGVAQTTRSHIRDVTARAMSYLAGNVMERRREIMMQVWVKRLLVRVSRSRSVSVRRLTIHELVNSLARYDMVDTIHANLDEGGRWVHAWCMKVGAPQHPTNPTAPEFLVCSRNPGCSGRRWRTARATPRRSRTTSRRASTARTRGSPSSRRPTAGTETSPSTHHPDQGHQSAAKGSSTTVSSSDIRLI
jgi:hypothetical protein